MDNNKFGQLLNTKKGIAIATVALLSWVMYADGEGAEAEENLISDIMKKGFIEYEIQTLLKQIGRNASAVELSMSLSHLKNAISKNDRVLFLALVCGLVASDGNIDINETLALELIADGLGVSDANLKEIFTNTTGHSYPERPDLSSLSWWKRYKYGENEDDKGKNNNRDRSSEDNSKKREESARRKDGKMSRMHALSILGLEENATFEEIRKSYLHLAKVHHPDRYEHLGQEAKATANLIFTRINLAYEFLTKS